MRKRNISLLILAAIVTFLMAGCKKDTTTLKARISPFSNESKVYIYGTSTPRWETDDLVNVNGTPCTVSVSTTTSTIEAPTSNAYQAVYPNDLVATNGNQLGNYTVTLNIPRVQAYETTTNGQVVKAPMGAFVSGSSNLQFTNMGALLAIAVKNDKSDRNNLVIDSIAVQTVGTSPVLLWGTATVNDIASEQRAYEISSTGLSETEIADHRIISLAKLSEQGNLATLATDQTETFYLYVPSVSGSIDNRYKITIYSHIGGTVYIYEKEQSNAGSGNVGLSQYAAVPYMTNSATETAQADTWIAGSIHSFFSDQGNNSRHKVMFAQGNLVWTGSSSYATGEYSFHTSQETSLLTSVTSTHTDLFYPNNTNNFTLSYDIGANIAIKVGDITCQTGAWKTLSQSQWLNILGIAGGGHPRTVNGGQGEGHCFNIVRLGSILGLLLYPDNYTGTTYSTSHPSSLNAYPEITEIPEGCVFLPATGYISNSGSGVLNVNSGYYWTKDGYTLTGKYYFYYLNFYSGSSTVASSIIQSLQVSNTQSYPKAAYRLVHDTTLPSNY
ncbi:MAG: hypothetical protein IKG88_06460 [Bacteroidales bacterium]|nr:hypothetical protein [Bacteroidales bacterium]